MSVSNLRIYVHDENGRYTFLEADVAASRERERWLEWNERRLKAEAEGQDFEEPIPSTRAENLQEFTEKTRAA